MVLNESTSLNDVVHSSLRLLEHSIPKQIAGIQLDLSDSLPLFPGNSSRIQQVVINLILNACQADTNPGLEIMIRSFFLEKEGEVVLQVQDSGTGIEKEKLAFLCDPFYTTKRNHGGTGLGLFISERIIKEHKGRLRFDSKLGVGTNVSIYLPVKTV
jgi:polar amino acid transport system substrate-binding protein